jgi:predicted site-specific integrase-resolvase
MDPDELTTAQAARILGVDRSAMSRLKPDRLRYRTTPGGHRRYHRSDVEALKADMDRGLSGGPRQSMEQRVSSLEQRVDKLEGDRA